MTSTLKRQVVRNLHLGEISSVDNPAQVGATAVLMKRADGADVDIRKNAAAVADGGDVAYSVMAFEDAMFRRADELALAQNVTPEKALAKNLFTDRTLMDLAHASEVARCSAYGAEVRKRYNERS